MEKDKDLGGAAVRGEATAVTDDFLLKHFNESGFFPENLSTRNRSAFYDAVRALVSPRAADAPSEPTRADLEAIDRAMQHMGDALNALDLADKHDEKISSPTRAPSCMPAADEPACTSTGWPCGLRGTGIGPRTW